MASADASRNRFLAICNRARAIPGSLGLRPHTLERVARFAESVREDVTEKVTPIVEANGQSPLIRWLTAEELTVGQLNPGTAEARFTPSFGGGGTDIALLRGDDLGPNDKLYFRITGPHHVGGALYRKAKLNDEKALHYTLQLVPVQDDA
jgi:hypothetical protein